MRCFFLAVVLVLMSGCAFKDQADAKFGDQHYKTAIALIELHRIRHGVYPSSIGDLTYIGEWDRIALNSVEYKKLDSGYELNISRGWIGKPTLSFPAPFWNNLGIQKTNVKRE
jgi:hypothetical protein